MTKLTKPVRRLVRCHVPHGVNPWIVVTIQPNGTIELREQRRRASYALGIGELYQQAVASQVRRSRV